MKKLRAISLIVKHKQNNGWICDATITNNSIYNNKAITGKIGTHYYCNSIEEAVDSVIECLDELGIQLWNNFDLIYCDSEQENSDECPEEVLDIFEKERERLRNNNIIAY